MHELVYSCFGFACSYFNTLHPMSSPLIAILAAGHNPETVHQSLFPTACSCVEKIHLLLSLSSVPFPSGFPYDYSLLLCPDRVHPITFHCIITCWHYRVNRLNYKATALNYKLYYDKGGERCVRKGRNGRELLRRLKPTVGCNASRRRTMKRVVIIIIVVVHVIALWTNLSYEY
jgi:hypothetical protein